MMLLQFMLTEMTKPFLQMNDFIWRKIFADLCNVFPFIQNEAERESAAASGLLSLSQHISPGKTTQVL